MSIQMKLFTVSVDSEDSDEGQWNDLFYVAAQDADDAIWLAHARVRNTRGTLSIDEAATEAHEYKGESKVLASFDPNEED
jgi:hypothetical protein